MKSCIILALSALLCMNIAGCNNTISNSDNSQNYAATPHTTYTQSDAYTTEKTVSSYSLPSSINTYDE
ncbi:MAG: hypothetical protein IJ583_12825, partial [Firmicutes bacterium]|nr:hypothetical protein [Bacillota bacterium]